MLDRNKWNHLTVFKKKMNSGKLENVTCKMCLEILFNIYV